MEKRLYSLILISSIVGCMYGQTMTFPSGASETGFSFSNWTGSGGTIWFFNLANPTTITVTSGVWNLTSFRTAPFSGNGNFRATSNTGESYTFNPSSGAATHTLNWNGITTLTITRIDPSGGSFDFDDVVYTTGVLPVNFTAFQAEFEDNQVKLDWIAEEKGPEAAYVIEKSLDGDLFEEIDRMPAQGLESESASYTWTDNNTDFTDAFFRIRQIDIDGQFVYSSIAQLSMEDRDKWKVGPNPSTGRFSVSGESGLMSVWNMLGQKMVEMRLMGSTEEVNLEHLPSGAYVLQLRTLSGAILNRRLVLE